MENLGNSLWQDFMKELLIQEQEEEVVGRMKNQL